MSDLSPSVVRMPIDVVVQEKWPLPSGWLIYSIQHHGLHDPLVVRAVPEPGPKTCLDRVRLSPWVFRWKW